MSLGALALPPMPGEAQTPRLCCQAELLLPPNLPRCRRRGRGRRKTMATATSSPSPAAFEAALAVPRAEHHSQLALRQTTGPVPPGPGCHCARPRVTVPAVPGEAGRGAAISSANRLWAVTVASKIWSHMWLAGEVAPQGPSGLMSPRRGPAAGGMGTGQPLLDPYPGQGQPQPRCPQEPSQPGRAEAGS